MLSTAHKRNQDTGISGMAAINSIYVRIPSINEISLINGIRHQQKSPVSGLRMHHLRPARRHF